MTIPQAPPTRGRLSSQASVRPKSRRAFSTSRGQTQTRAMNACKRYGGGCKVVINFHNACGALAVGDGNGSGYAWGASQEDAEWKALANCDQYTYSCVIVRSVCSW